MKYFLPLLLIASLLVSIASAQQVGTPPPAPVLQTQKPEDVDVVRITTNLVQVDAVVTDKNGKLVTDLKPEEVEIFEDGHKQKITHFTFNLSETAPIERVAKSAAADKTAPPVPTSRIRPEDIKRTIAIVVDDLGLSFESTYFVRRALKKFVDEQMQPGDLVAIIRTSGGMGALQQFTSDKRQLQAAVDRVKWNANGRSGVSPFEAIQPPTPGPKGADIDQANEDLDTFRKDVFAVGTLGAVSYVVKGLKELPGRKSILLVSDGFKIYDLDDPSHNYLAREKLRHLIDEAGRASVVIYTMNATGLQTLGITAADDLSGRDTQQLQDAMNARRNEAFDTQQGLDFLAQQTGGIAIRNTNDLSGGIHRVLEDQKGFYLIGYRPDEGTFDKRTGRRTFHQLTLKVTRPGKFNVRMRNGFLGFTDEEKPAPRSLAQKLYDALASPFGASGVHLQLTSLFANDAKAGSFMRSILHIDSHDLTFTEEPNNMHKCVFDVLSMTFGDNGVPIDQSGRTYTMVLPEELYKRAQRDGLVYYVTVPVKKAGAYQLRMSLRDTATDRIGSASQFVEVPDLKKNRLALSGLALRGYLPTKTNGPSTNAAANSQAANTDSPAADQEGIDKGSAEASPAVRHFHNGMFLSYGFYVYNAHVEKTSAPQLMTQVILFHDGKPVFTGHQNPMGVNGQPDVKRLVGGGSIQLGTDLPPGDYVLQVIVTDPQADKKNQTASQWMDFSIVK
ncbi:MAG TPA: VWA domain-containing protein [Pyrinomonadaceae bacterium]|nr:VWA domain-containing protein [Pyrinomonadaceae bacterium]